jgi:DNA topoisomerase-1
MEKSKERMKQRKERDRLSIEKQKLQIEEQKKSKDYNLNTSLKSYIDPRVYHKWAKKVDYDWKKYYSKSLQKKFSWLEEK